MYVLLFFRISTNVADDGDDNSATAIGEETASKRLSRDSEGKWEVITCCKQDLLGL